MPSAVLRAVLAESWRRPGRQLLVGLVIVVATAFAAASLMLTDSARSAIVEQLAGTPQAASLVITPVDSGPAEPSATEQLAQGEPGEPGGGLSEAVQKQARATPGVAEVTAFGSGGVLFSAPGQPGDGEPWTALAAATGPLSRYPVVAGRLPEASNEAAVSEETARRMNLAPGSPLTLIAADGRSSTYTVSGVATVRLQAVNTVLLQPVIMTRLTRAAPSQLDVVVAPGADLATVGRQLAAAVGPTVLVTDAVTVRAAELSNAFGSLEGIFAALAVFGGTAVLAAALTTSSVYATVTGGRRRTVVLLRRVGAGRGQVLRALLIDAALLGAAAGLLGVLLSLGIVDLVGLAVLGAVGQDLPAPGNPAPLLVGCLLGAVFVTVLSAVGAAVRASGQRPAEASENDVPQPGTAARVARLVLAVVLTAAAVLAALDAAGTADPTTALVLVSGAGVAAFLAVVAAGPVLLPLLASLLGRLLAPLTGLPGRLAMHSAERAPNRAATTAAALVLASLLLAVVLVGLESMSTSVQARIASRFPAAITTVATQEATLPTDLSDRLAALPGAGYVAAVENATLEAGDQDIALTAVDPGRFPALLGGAVDAGTLADLGPGMVALDRAQAAAWGVGVGDPVTFAVPGTPVQLRVAAVYRSSGVLAPVTVHPADLPRIVPGPPAVRTVLVDPADGTDVEALRTAVAGTVAGTPGALVQVPADLRDELHDTMDLTRAVAIGLVAATVLVAVCGVAVALALAIRERHRESTTLRALGLTPGQTIASIGVESTLLGLAGVLIGTSLGMLFGVLAVRTLAERAVLPAAELAGSALALVLVAAVAGTLPALAAARRRPLPHAAD